MKRHQIPFLLGIPATLLSALALAHDPSLHKKGEAPDCAAMKGMDQAEMDMNDPVMQAMMQQCMKDLHHGQETEKSSVQPRENAEQDPRKQSDQR